MGEVIVATLLTHCSY